MSDGSKVTLRFSKDSAISYDLNPDDEIVFEIERDDEPRDVILIRRVILNGVDLATGKEVDER